MSDLWSAAVSYDPDIEAFNMVQSLYNFRLTIYLNKK